MPRPRTFDDQVVLEAVQAQFSSLGYAATSTDVLAAAAGLGKGSLYGAFGGKRALFLAALERYCRQLVDDARRTLAGPDAGALERVRHYLLAVGGDDEAGHPQGCLLAKGIMELAEHDADVAQRAQSTLAALEYHLGDALLAAQRNGDIKPGADPQALARFLVVLHRGLNAAATAGFPSSYLTGVVSTAFDSVSARST